MGRRSQVTLIIIAALVVLLLIALFFALRKESFSYGEDIVSSESLQFFVEDCVRKTAIDAELEYGLHKQISPPLIKDYLLENLPGCFDGFSSFREQDFRLEERGDMEIDVQISTDAMFVELEYPISLYRSNSVIDFEKEIYRLPRTVMEDLDPDDETLIVSPDGSMMLEIPPGTKAYLDGEEIDRVGIKLLDREFNGNTNSVVAGMLAFNGLPHGTTFSQPVKLTLFYDQNNVPVGMREEDIRIGYFNDELGAWMGLPTLVDPEKNMLVVDGIQHFSIYTDVLGCGGETRTIEYITPNLVSHECGMCDDPGWTTTDLPEGLKTGIRYDGDDFEMDVCDWIQEGAEGEDLDFGGCSQECKSAEKEKTTMTNEWQCDELGGDFNFDFSTCKQYMTYYGYEEKPISAKRRVKLTFEGDGKTCFAVEDENSVFPKIKTPSNDVVTSKVEISIPYCSEKNKESQCMIENGIFVDYPEKNKIHLFFDFNIINDGDDQCLAGNAKITFTGVGITTPEEATSVVCTKNQEGTFEFIGLQSGDPKDLNCQECKCTDDSCKWTSAPGKCLTEDSCTYSLEGYVMQKANPEDEDKQLCMQCSAGKWEKINDDKCANCNAEKEQDKEDDAENSETEGNADSPTAEVVSGLPYENRITGFGAFDSNLPQCITEDVKKELTEKPVPASSGGYYSSPGTGSGSTGSTTASSSESRPPCGDPEGTTYESCPEDFEESLKGKKITLDKVADTRDKRFCDSLGDFPTDFGFAQETELLIFGSAMREGECWLLVEAQDDSDGYSPDMYIRLSAAEKALEEEEIIDEEEEEEETETDMVLGFLSVSEGDSPYIKEMGGNAAGYMVPETTDLLDGMLAEAADNSLGIIFMETYETAEDKMISENLGTNYMSFFSHPGIQGADNIISYMMLDEACRKDETDARDYGMLYDSFKSVSGYDAALMFGTLDCFDDYLSSAIDHSCDDECGGEGKWYKQGDVCYKDECMTLCRDPCQDSGPVCCLETEYENMCDASDAGESEETCIPGRCVFEYCAQKKETYILDIPEGLEIDKMAVLQGSEIIWKNDLDVIVSLRIDDQDIDEPIAPGESFTHIFSEEGDYEYSLGEDRIVSFLHVADASCSECTSEEIFFDGESCYSDSSCSVSCVVEETVCEPAAEGGCTSLCQGEGYTDGEVCYEDDSCTQVCTRCLESSGEYFIDIADFRFMPEEATIPKGTKITWVNHDNVDHSAKGEGFDIGPLAPQQTMSVLFDEPGVYVYETYYAHESEMGPGKIIVEDLDYVGRCQDCTGPSYFFDGYSCYEDPGCLINCESEEEEIILESCVLDTEDRCTGLCPEDAYTDGTYCYSDSVCSEPCMDPGCVLDTEEFCEGICTDTAYTDGWLCYLDNSCTEECVILPCEGLSVIPKMSDILFFTVSLDEWDTEEGFGFIVEAENILEKYPTLKIIPVISLSGSEMPEEIFAASKNLIDQDIFSGLMFIYEGEGLLEDSLDEDISGAIKEVFMYARDPEQEGQV